MEEKTKTTFPPELPEISQLPRITMSRIWKELLSQLNLEKGFIYTIRRFGFSPGKATNEYLYQDRSKLVPPMRYLFISVTISAIITIQFLMSTDVMSDMVQGQMNGLTNMEEGPVKEYFEYFFHNNMAVNSKYFNILLLFSVPLSAAATTIVYKLRKYNYAEHLVINGYIYATSTAIYILAIPFTFFADLQNLALIITFLALPYSMFAFYQVFDDKKWKGIWKSLLAMLISFIFSLVAISLLGNIVAGIFAFLKIKL